MIAIMGMWLARKLVAARSKRACEVGNMLSTQLLNTGAFARAPGGVSCWRPKEIQHGDQLIWSSMETRRLPTMLDLQRPGGALGCRAPLRRAFQKRLASDVLRRSSNMGSELRTGVEFIQLREER